MTILYNIEFYYNGEKIYITANEFKTMDFVLQMFCKKKNIDINAHYFLYNGDKVDRKLKVEQMINKADNLRSRLCILVSKIENPSPDINKILINSDDENRLIKDFRIFYQIEKKICVGLYGSVFTAKLRDTGEKRVISIIEKSNLKKNYLDDFEIKKHLNNILNEINIMKLLEGNNKENINTIKFYEYFNTKDEISVVKEFIDDDLDNILRTKKQPFNKEDIFDILIQLNKSFKIMHENKIVHRDIKLKNILVKYNTQDKNKYIIKLSGYGISKIITNINEKLSLIVGTPNYMAPEIFNKIGYDEKCDLWSLGISIYQLFFNEFPINKKSIQFKDCLKKTNDGELDDL